MTVPKHSIHHEPIHPIVATVTLAGYLLLVSSAAIILIQWFSPVVSSVLIALYSVLLLLGLLLIM